MRFIALDTVSSTNDVTRRLVQATELEGPICVLARQQTAGRGTRGRTWLSPRDAGAYFSVVHPAVPELPIPVTSLFTQAAGVACVDSLRCDPGLRVGLRGVNDLVIAGRKLGGILTEALYEQDRMQAVIVGVGINVRQVPLRLHAEALPPTSLEAEIPTGDASQFEIRTLVSRLARAVYAWNERVCRGESEVVTAAWAERRTD